MSSVGIKAPPIVIADVSIEYPVPSTDWYCPPKRHHGEIPKSNPHWPGCLYSHPPKPDCGFGYIGANCPISGGVLLIVLIDRDVAFNEIVAFIPYGT
ncbi:hypothetical protein SCT_2189 [Sulfuricella sp. T08]|nr:hypothetical protein SCT_2189 [Sulfuricella sp. T08]